ncbi:MAG: hypothetical protein KC464_32010 [Myxococcales bacterium]|nr:hypothetical protein [Myxococcales bacterium]
MRSVLGLVSIVVMAAACGGDDAAGPDASGPPDAAAAPDAGPVLVGGCAPDAVELCDWIPDAPLTQVTPVPTVMLDYQDATGATRTFQIAIHVPDGAPEPMPVVVWSHGGNDGVDNALNVAPEWAAAFVAAGYLTISIAHPGRDATSQAALCDVLGYDAAGCLTFKHLHWDRPHDAARVFDFIEAQAVAGPYAGRIDASRIVYAGHSAGAGSTLMVNGAPRDFAGQRVALADPRPVAFVSNSPQGPGDEGFDEASFGEVTRPNLVNTGVGDDTPTVEGTNRARSFDLMPPGHKYRLFIAEPAAKHETFDLSNDACTTFSTNNGLDPARCDDYRRWIASAALAFVDAEVRGDADAAAYLASDNLEVLAGGAAAWSRR